jgi:hypothetical protein
VDEFAFRLVDEDVRDMAVSETGDVTRHRVDGDAARVVEPHVEPQRGNLVLLPEEVAKERRESLHDLGKDLALVPVAVFGTTAVGTLDLAESLASFLRLAGSHLSARTEYSQFQEERKREKEEEVNVLVKTAQAASERSGVGGELDQSVASLKGDDLVRSNVKLATTTAFIAFEEIVDEGEELLHDGVLTNVVLALELQEEKESASNEKAERGKEDEQAACTPFHRFRDRS